MSSSEIRLFRIIFVIAALWNLLGGILGYTNTADTFQRLFGRDPQDPVLLAIFQGATGTTLTYFFGYLFVALNPLRQTGVVIIGTIGKIGFAMQMWKFYAAGQANANALFVVVGDLLFVVIFLWYFFRVVRTGNSLLGTLHQ